MTSLQQQARALGDPTRHEVFRYLVDAAAPRRCSRAHRTLRTEPQRHPSAPGQARRRRPRHRGDGALDRAGPAATSLHASPPADSRWGVTGPYERLSLLLSEIVRTGESPVEVGRRAGRRRRLGSADAADPVAELVDQMARQGFDPTVTQRGRAVDVTLRTCPFATTALADPDTVCGLHLGMAYGIAEAVGGLMIDELIPKDPRRAHCRLRCHVDADQHSVGA